MKRSMLRFAAVAAVMVVLAFGAQAADSILVKDVSVVSGPSNPVVEYLGGTPGVVRITYAVTGSDPVPAGEFAKFKVDLGVQPETTSSTYPLTLNLGQNGGSITLTPVPSSFTLSDAAWADSTVITVSLDNALYTGQTAVGNLQISTRHNALNTPPSIQVKIKHVDVSPNCVGIFDFVTSQALNEVDTLMVNLSRGKTVSTNPGQLSDNILVVNQCGTVRSFDLEINLDSSFQTNPVNNPGNAVFTYFSENIVNPDTFSITAFGGRQKQGQRLCLAGVDLQDGTFLATVHMGIQSGLVIPPAGTFTFSATLRASSAGGAYTACGGPALSDATPNPAVATVPYTTK